MRLIHECREQWDDPLGWQEHLTASIETLVGGYGSLVSINSLQYSAAQTIDAHSASHNGPQMRRVFDDFIKAGGVSLMPSAKRVMRELSERGRFTWNEQALVGAKKFRQSRLYHQHLRHLDADNVIFHSVALSDGTVFSIGLLRTRQDPAYTPVDERLIALIGDAAAIGVNDGWCLNGRTGRHLLTQREQETLELLLDGLSEKEIAKQMALSARTVHDYVTSIYRKLGFTSRARLMAAYVKRRFPHS